jgi:hypothetical protein
MKKLLSLTLLFITTHSFSQTDHNGNPVFNSVSTTEENIKDFQLISHYYTLKTNIKNKYSSVYISDNPTLDEIESAAINLPSDFFLITKNQAMLNMVLIQNLPNRYYFVIKTSTGKQTQFPCSINGDISENRANEIIKENFEPISKIKGNKLYFNNHKLTIISDKEI